MENKNENNKYGVGYRYVMKEQSAGCNAFDVTLQSGCQELADFLADSDSDNGRTIHVSITHLKDNWVLASVVHENYKLMECVAVKDNGECEDKPIEDITYEQYCEWVKTHPIG